jgi:hypothetical protein
VSVEGDHWNLRSGEKGNQHGKPSANTAEMNEKQEHEPKKVFLREADWMMRFGGGPRISIMH